jgi:transcriptional regulator
MYIRPVHAELDPAVLHAFIRTYPLGLLTTAIPHSSIPTIQTTHIPFVLDTPQAGPAILRGHIARANPQTKAMLSAVSGSGALLADEVQLLFQAPLHHYITPKFYTTTKPDSGKVVPTWDYAAVQVYGRARVHDTGLEAARFLQAQIEALTQQQERMAGHEQPWRVSDAPDKYIDLLRRAIVGIEIEITRVEGRWKMSQELADGDWAGVVAGFKGLGTKEGDEMARAVESRGMARNL